MFKRFCVLQCNHSEEWPLQHVQYYSEHSPTEGISNLSKKVQLNQGGVMRYLLNYDRAKLGREENAKLLVIYIDLPDLNLYHGPSTGVIQGYSLVTIDVNHFKCRCCAVYAHTQHSIYICTYNIFSINSSSYNSETYFIILLYYNVLRMEIIYKDMLHSSVHPVKLR